MTSPHLIPGSAHFQVIEEPAYLPSGSGEHLYVDIEKEGLPPIKLPKRWPKPAANAIVILVMPDAKTATPSRVNGLVFISATKLRSQRCKIAYRLVA